MSSQIREPAVSGLFYEDDPLKLQQQLATLFDAVPTNIPKPDNIQALIVPHAGYVYSGKVAASAFSLLPSNKTWDRIFIIGSSHRAHFNGAAVCQHDSFYTPLGLVEIDQATSEALIQSSPLIKAITSMHENEHSLEVQLPFLQHRLANPFKIVPILLGTQTSADCRVLGDALRPYFTPNNLFVISTDFSHYPPFKDATTADNSTATAIVTNSPTQLILQLERNKVADFYNLQTSLCGWTSVLTLMYMTEKTDNAHYHKILYENSGHSPIGDKNRVVGYWAIAVETSHEAKPEFSVSEHDKALLLSWSRQCLTADLKGKTALNPEIESHGGLFQEPLSAFVTLHKNGRLRGCIGRFDPNQPLWETIREMTHAAAFNDQRFPDVTIDELTDIDIEISILSPMRKIASTDEIILGKHGVYLKHGRHSATFLPQVATQHNWTLDEFLGHLSNEKAGLGPDGWKTAELFVYEAVVFGEKQP